MEKYNDAVLHDTVAYTDDNIRHLSDMEHIRTDRKSVV